MKYLDRYHLGAWSWNRNGVDPQFDEFYFQEPHQVLMVKITEKNLLAVGRKREK